jgi:hypothetical protein
MPISEARISANRANSLKSCGPRTADGKERSRRNGLKHGLTGAGVVMLPEDSTETERRDAELQRELDPQSAMGKILVRQLASLSVRSERGARQESAAVARRVRHAAEEFDEARFERAELLFEFLAENPRDYLRKLRQSPEGIDRLLLAWGELRDELTRRLKPDWNVSHIEKFGNLTGSRLEAAEKSWIGVFSRASWGNFNDLPDDEGANLEPLQRRAWARDRLVERIDAEVSGLEAHRETLDLDAIEQDRAEAGDVSMFDPSREATLARRYELESRRGFFLALKELRRVEAEAVDRPAQAAPPAPEPAALASSWEIASPAVRVTRPAIREVPSRSRRRLEAILSSVRGAEELAMMVGRADGGLE